MYCACHKDYSFGFVREVPEGVSGTVVVYGADPVTPANLIQKIGNNKRLFIISEDPEEAFREFRSQFRQAEAAGGIVENPDGKILMIYRKGWWDLPKGHVDPGETPEQAAVREVWEECGIKADGIRGLLAETFHFYDDFGSWELKRTLWYDMECNGSEDPRPQAEEGIEKALWLDSASVGEILKQDDIYSIAKDLLEQLMSKRLDKR